MTTSWKLVICAVIGLAMLDSMPPVARQAQPAFPGAEGWGSTTPGGRGGASIHVTNLNEEGPGSLRAAVLMKGPRLITFDVGGVIHHRKEPLSIEEPYVTISGIGSPVPGITLADEEVRVQTHDVVLRHLRIRTGDADVPRDGWDNRDALNLGHPDRPTDTHDVIIDHCSFSWAVDETSTTWYRTHDVTFQWCIFAEGLRNSKHPKGAHSMGVLAGPDTYKVCWHHCLFATSNERMPQIAGCDGAAMICCTVFDWGKEPTALEHLGCRAYFVNDAWQPGPDTVSPWPGSIRIAPDATDAQVYIEGCVDRTNPTGAKDCWSMLWLDAGAVPPKLGHRITTLPSDLVVTTQDAITARQLVLIGAGAKQPRRDAHDARVVLQAAGFDDSASFFVDSQDQVGGW